LAANTRRLVKFGGDGAQAAEVGAAAAEFDVGAAPRHVGGDADWGGLSRLGNDLSFFAVAGGIEESEVQPALGEMLGEHFAGSDVARAYEDEATRGVDAEYFSDDGVPFGGLVGKGAVGSLVTDAGAVGGDGDDGQK
jgi:hypothetical protein